MKRPQMRVSARPAPMPASLLDRFVAYVAPQAALKRLQARRALALVNSYEGASRSRRGVASESAIGGGPIADLTFDLPALRARSRALYRNSAIPRGAINEKVSIVVGPGHIVSPQIDFELLGISQGEAQEWEGRASQLWRMHAKSENIHAGRTLNFAELEALILKSTLLSGDVLVLDRFKRRPGAIASTCFQLIEGDRLASPVGKIGDARESDGVRRDADGEPTHYHILDEHPGEFTTTAGLKGKWYAAYAPDGARRIRHLMFAKRPGQVRGEPFLAPVIEAMAQLKRYSEAELMAAVVNSCFAITSTTPDGTGLALTEEQVAGGSGSSATPGIDIVEPGSIVNLAEGETIEGFTPERPSANFDPFFRSIVSQMAVALDTTEEVLMRSFKASYSASRGAIEVAYRFCQSYDSWLVSKFCQPAYEAFIAEQVANGQLSAPGFFGDPVRRAAWCGAQWTGPARISLNPKAEADADSVDLELGVTNKFLVAAKRGQILEQVIAGRAKAQSLEDKAGLTTPPAADAAPSDEIDDEDVEDGEKKQRGARAKGTPMQIHVNLPKVEVNVPEIKAPEIRIPDVVARVELPQFPAPQIHFEPKIENPAPIVHVAAPTVRYTPPAARRVERTVVTKHDDKGRIIEFVKTISGDDE